MRLITTLLAMALWLPVQMGSAHEMDFSTASLISGGPGWFVLTGVGVDSSASYDVRFEVHHSGEEGCLPPVVVEGSLGYPLHANVTSTVFWVGEEESDENGRISNRASAWDQDWVAHYGGVDSPYERQGYLPAGFSPRQNPFYVALPYNDLDPQGHRKPEAAEVVYWYDQVIGEVGPGESVLKDRWVKIIKAGKVAYAQWEDVGPFGEDDAAYVFGTAQPANRENQRAGIDVSPAVRDYLGLGDIDKVDWQFVDEEDVPPGPWKMVVTRRGEWFRPSPDDTFAWQLDGELNLGYDATIYDVDLFDTDPAVIEQLHSMGRRVICYFSAGTFEDWRPDADQFPLEVLGNALEEWEGERWLDIRDYRVHRIMLQRLDLAVSKGCDGVEPDNVDGYANDTGFPLTAEDQLLFNRFLADAAHSRNLAVALKNDGDQAEELAPHFDFALVEQCVEYDECELYLPFSVRGKLVIDVEYADDSGDVGPMYELCGAVPWGFKLLVLPWDLDGSFRYTCD